MSSVGANDGRSLLRDIGLLGTVNTVVAGTLGVGLFIILGTASSMTGPSVILVVVLSGLLATSIALNYGWTATAFPGAAGSYAYVPRAFDSRFSGSAVTWSKWLGYMATDVAVRLLG